MTVLDASTFAGATVDAKINSCIAALGTGGGVCDARNINGGQWNPCTIGAPGVTILGPNGQQILNGTVDIRNPAGGALWGFRWLGLGGLSSSSPYAPGTQFYWNGAATAPAFRLRGVAFSTFQDFQIQAYPAKPLAVGIQLETLTGVTSTYRELANILIDGIAGGIGVGVRWCAGDRSGTPGGAGPDNNNDLDFIKRVYVANYKNIGFSVEGSQSVGHNFEHCTAASNGNGNVGVSTAVPFGSTVNGGAFNWRGGSMGGNKSTDFDIGTPPQHPIAIDNFISESSNRMLQTGNEFNNPCFISINNARFAANALNADNKVVIYQARGVFSFTNSVVTGIMAGRKPILWCNPLGTPFRATASGNMFTWPAPLPTGGAPDIIVTTAGTCNKYGNIITDEAGNFVLSATQIV